MIRQIANEAWNEGACLLRCTKIRFCASAPHQLTWRTRPAAIGHFSVAFTRTNDKQQTHRRGNTSRMGERHKSRWKVARKVHFILRRQGHKAKCWEHCELTKTHHPPFSKSTVHLRSLFRERTTAGCEGHNCSEMVTLVGDLCSQNSGFWMA